MKILKVQRFVLMLLALLTAVFFITAFSALISISSAQVKIANAESEKYIFIPYTGELKNLSEANPSGYVFSNETIGEDKGFYLTQTYYAKYISTKQLDVEYYEISYCGITGYIKADSKLQPKEITEVTESNAYPQIYLSLNDEKQDFTVNFFTYTREWTFKYLGESTEADEVYVLCTKDSENKIIETGKSNFNPYTVPLHSITQAAKAAETKTEPTPDGTLTPATSNKTLRGILIAGIVFPAVVIIILIFIPRKKKQTYDDFSTRRGVSPYDYPKNAKRTQYPDRYEEDYDYNRRRYDRYDDYPPNDRREREIDYDYRNDDRRNDRY